MPSDRGVAQKTCQLILKALLTLDHKKRYLLERYGTHDPNSSLWALMTVTPLAENRRESHEYAFCYVNEVLFVISLRMGAD